MARPDDMVVFTGVFIGQPGLTQLVRGLATEFPDRKILLQLKAIFVDTEVGDAFLAACTEDLPNVVPTKAPIFELFTQARYAFSDPSTVLLEALQFGMTTFAADISPIQKVSILREFPDLCVTSPEQAASRIRAIEAGTWNYPRDSFGDLIDLSGKVIFDVIREDMGLPARAPVQPKVIME